MNPTTSTANPYEVAFRMADGHIETIEVYAYNVSDALASAVYALIARVDDIEGVKPLSILPPKRCWAMDRRETSAVDRILSGIVNDVANEKRGGHER